MSLYVVFWGKFNLAPQHNNNLNKTFEISLIKGILH